ncbi:MAG: L,D-transpeptidase family protein [Chthoniobacteraceae bacterium]|nr:L,D-transpeptidase family protein [Chthoniobacteraceae bacterium]
MIRLLRPALAIGLLSILTGCSTVSDLVVTNIPDGHQGKPKIVVNLRKQTATLFKGKAQIAESRISAGREGHDTPVGRFHVLRKDEDHRSSVYGDYADRRGRVVTANVDTRKTARPPRAHFVGAPMPFFIEFSPGYGLHAGYLPGYPASHGCVRMPYWKARQFYNTVKPGTPVIIQRG